MNRLSEKKYWDSLYRDGSPGPTGCPGSSVSHDRLARLRDYSRGYTNYLLYEVLLRDLLPHDPTLKLVEIGSAPGHILLKYHQLFGYEPYGIEYSDQGVAVNRTVFETHGLNPSNVIAADFFSEQLHRDHAGAFDIVCSHGFIEHFTDPASVIEKHLNLVKPGGYLVITIPHFRGVNRVFMRAFCPELLPTHNLSIMDSCHFRRIFDEGRVTSLFCDYLGTFDFNLFSTRPDSKLRPVLNSLFKLQKGLNIVSRATLGSRLISSRRISPILVFVGKRKR